jgi:hypothetical protein
LWLRLVLQLQLLLLFYTHTHAHTEESNTEMNISTNSQKGEKSWSWILINKKQFQKWRLCVFYPWGPGGESKRLLSAIVLVQCLFAIQYTYTMYIYALFRGRRVGMWVVRWCCAVVCLCLFVGLGSALTSHQPISLLIFGHALCENNLNQSFWIW